LRRIPVERASSGNVVGLVGLSEAAVGQTICNPGYPIEEFEAIKHIFEPVVTKSIEPKYPQDLPKLIDILKTLSREDTTLRVKINQETGETLVSGLGELHLDAKVERKIREKGARYSLARLLHRPGKLDGAACAAREIIRDAHVHHNDLIVCCSLALATLALPEARGR